MTGRRRQLGLLLAGSLLLAGCSSSRAATSKPGTIVPDGSTVGAAAAPASGNSAPAKPSASALMICAAETRASIATVLAIKQIPAGMATFAEHLYTCTYRLPVGTLVLSVKESPNSAATTVYYTTLRDRLGKTENLPGLGEAAYGAKDGTVVLRKDNDVLRVDATRLRAVFGPQHTKRTDFAYEIASKILGCWTGA